MLRKRRLILADEMGLGKTIQVIGALNAQPTIQSVLIVCPKSMLISWAKELEAWLTRPLTVATVKPGASELPACDVLLINYDVIFKRKPELLARAPYDAIICDEAHYLKNPEAQRTRGVLGAHVRAKKLRRAPEDEPIPSDFMWLLTGSPILNHPIELWPLLKAVDTQQAMPRVVSFMAFRARYCDPKKRTWGMDYSGTSNMEERHASIERRSP